MLSKSMGPGFKSPSRLFRIPFVDACCVLSARHSRSGHALPIAGPLGRPLDRRQRGCPPSRRARGLRLLWSRAHCGAAARGLLPAARGHALRFPARGPLRLARLPAPALALPAALAGGCVGRLGVRWLDRVEGSAAAGPPAGGAALPVPVGTAAHAASCLPARPAN